jgi:hypothetical protein
VSDLETHERTTAEPRTTIEPKHLAAREADTALVKAIRGRRGELTKADAVAASGLPTHVVDESLERLLKQYKSHLAVTEEGELLYSFEPSFTPRGAPTLGDRLRAAWQWLARGAISAFRVVIAAALIIYFVLFVILMIVALTSGGDRRRRRGFDLPLWLFWWSPGTFRGLPHDRYGRAVVKGPKKPFIQSVYDFVFGPARPPHDPLADEREILAFLRENGGRLTATDLVTLHGWSYRRAEEEATRLLVDYDGEPEVTEEGVLVYAFPKLLRTASDGEAEGGWRPAWQKLEPRPRLTGNKSSTNWLVGLFAAFNVFGSIVLPDVARAEWGLAGTGWEIALRWVPMVLFGLFLVLPGLRAVSRWVGDRGRAKRNRRRELVREILAERGGPFPITDEKRALALPFEGEMDVNDRGEPFIVFHRVKEEREALKKHLAGVDLSSERRVGPVLFGSDGDRDLS